VLIVEIGLLVLFLDGDRVDAPLSAFELVNPINVTAGMSTSSSPLVSCCSTRSICSSPEQHILDAVNSIERRGGNEAPCLDRLTRLSEVTIRMKVGLPVPV
jgi:hypothetical protein